MVNQFSAHIGFVSASTVVLPWEGLELLPAGTRVSVTGMNVLRHDRDEFARAGTEFSRAVEALAKDGAAGVLVNAAPLSATWGLRRESAVVTELEQRLHIEVVTSAAAILTVARAFAIEKVLLVSAYSDAVNAGLEHYFAEGGLACVGSAGMSADGPSASGRLGPEDFARLATHMLASGENPLDAIVLGSRGSAVASVTAVARATRLPVLHGTTCGLWELARRLGAGSAQGPVGVPLGRNDEQEADGR